MVWQQGHNTPSEGKGKHFGIIGSGLQLLQLVPAGRFQLEAFAMHNAGALRLGQPRRWSCSYNLAAKPSTYSAELILVHLKTSDVDEASRKPRAGSSERRQPQISQRSGSVRGERVTGEP